MAETGPVKGDLKVYLDTDNIFDFQIDDEDGTRLDVTGWTADLEVDKSTKFSDVKLTVSATVETDPDDGAATLLRVAIIDDVLQPGSADDKWPVTSSDKKYPYSLKRTNPGAEKILRLGKFIVARARV